MELPKIKLADKTQLALAKKFGKRYRIEEDGCTLDYSIWKGNIYLHDEKLPPPPGLA